MTPENSAKTRPHVIFLVHRLPFPPNKGDKIRSFHVFSYLAERYAVHLGCFVDSDQDMQYIDKVSGLCESVMIRRLKPWKAKLRSALGLIRGEALGIPYYFDSSLQDWVTKTVNSQDVSTIVAFSSTMAQYLQGRTFEKSARIVDFVDVDSDKWRQFSDNVGWPRSWIFGREAKYLAAFERSVAEEVDAVVFATANEANLFAQISPNSVNRHHVVENGVATDYFDPAIETQCPFDADKFPIVFTGMMDYLANIDAVEWFATEVFSIVRASEPAAEFWIVGASPSKDVLALCRHAGIRVTGAVDDVRPYLQHAAFAVAPLRIARGIQNKVLEALAMNCRVLCSPEAAAGLQLPLLAPIIVAESAPKMADAAIALINDNQSANQLDTGRQYVLKYYSWQQNLRALEGLSDVKQC